MVGQRKNKADRWMPPRVYRGKSRYEYRPASGETIKLCRVPKDKIETEKVKADVWAEYAKAKDAPVAINDVNKLIEAFHSSAQFTRLSANTQTDYNHYCKRISRVFGHMSPRDITKVNVRQFMDVLGNQGKLVTANRHKSYLSTLLSWGSERGWLEDNPAFGVKPFKEQARERYVEDWEFNLVQKVARESAYPYVAPMMDMAYLCRARTIELRALTEADIADDGIYLRRTKGSVSEVTGWSDRMVSAVKEARSVYSSAPVSIGRPLFHGKKGAPIPKSSFKTAWARIMRKALEAGLTERFTFHDLKAKGVTDHKDKASGHRSKKMQAVYNRRPDMTTPTR